MAVEKDRNMSRLAQRTGISRATLYRIKNGQDRNVEFSTYGKLAKFVLETE